MEDIKRPVVCWRQNILEKDLDSNQFFWKGYTDLEITNIDSKCDALLFKSLTSKLKELKCKFNSIKKLEKLCLDKLNSVKLNELITAKRKSGYLLPNEVWPFYQYFSRFDRKVVNDEKYINLVFKLDSFLWLNFIEEVEILRIPDIRSIQIDFFPKEWYVLSEFIHNWYPFNLSNLILNYFWQDDPAIMNWYINWFENIFKSTKLDVYIRYFDFSTDSFERTIKACSNSERIVFRGWIIALDRELNFSGPKYKTRYLSFDSTGWNFGNDWRNNPDKYRRILKAISEWELKYSLKCINLYACDFDEDYTQELLLQYDISHISIIERLDDPYERI